MTTKTLVMAAACALMPCLATAQERVLQFEIGVGTRVAPLYQGSDEYTFGPSLGGSLNALSFGSLNLGGGDVTGFGVAPSFGYIGERSSDDAAILKGIKDIDAAFEIGAKARYRWENAEVFGAVRKGVTGHSGVVAELGADVILFPDSDTTLRVGPRVSFADQSYMEDYFSVPASAVSLAPYSAEGGIKTAGIEISLRREVSDRWAVEGKLGWDQFVGSAADSPIVKAGSTGQGTIGLMLIRKFDLRF